jgi:Ca2+/H+ antiporter
VLAAMEIVIIKKGTINLKTDSIAAAVMIIFEIMAGLQLLKAYIEKSEVKTQEKLLEIEYQIAALTDKLGSNETTE